MNLRRKTVVTVISKIGDRRPKADACLVVIYGQGLGAKHALKAGEMIVGRSSQAQLQIDHESVSRRHARIVLTESGVLLADLGSTNGTYVNDEPITERTLAHGDLLKVGRTILKYLSTDNIEAAYHEEIHRLTTIDGLTRCFNARYVREALIREVSRATRYTRPLSVLMFDVDDFARINEEYGHLAGDAILAQLGKRLGRRVRREDILARTAGGEFALVTPEVDKQGAVYLGERVLRIIGETAFGFDDVQIPVTLSIGVAAVDEIKIPEAPEYDTAPGIKPKEKDTPAAGTIPDPFQSSSPSSSSTSEFSIFENSRSGELVERFHSASDQLLQLGRQRLAQAKSDGKGRLVS
ncbi:MAG: GGDEF domain-containing protein [Deltaproteobacteria bacterium]|nr:GGDEF domain-containing protein [Deltaproteobacteria bacterium]